MFVEKRILWKRHCQIGAANGSNARYKKQKYTGKTRLWEAVLLCYRPTMCNTRS